MKTFAISVICIMLCLQSAAQSVTPKVLLDISMGKQNKDQIIDMLGDKDLLYGMYKDSVLTLTNQTSLKDSNFVLFQMILDDRSIEYLACKKTIYEGWRDELEELGFLHLGSRETEHGFASIYAKDDQRVATTINPKEKFLKYKLNIYKIL